MMTLPEKMIDEIRSTKGPSATTRNRIARIHSLLNLPANKSGRLLSEIATLTGISQSVASFLLFIMCCELGLLRRERVPRIGTHGRREVFKYVAISPEFKADWAAYGRSRAIPVASAPTEPALIMTPKIEAAEPAEPASAPLKRSRRIEAVKNMDKYTLGELREKYNEARETYLGLREIFGPGKHLHLPEEAH